LETALEEILTPKISLCGFGENNIDKVTKVCPVGGGAAQQGPAGRQGNLQDDVPRGRRGLGAHGYAVVADDPGVIMLSGYSPALMKFVLSSEMTEELVADVVSTRNAISMRNAVKEKMKNKWQITPGEVLHMILDDSGSDDVRMAINDMSTSSFLCL
jgi:hypothetical protein